MAEMPSAIAVDAGGSTTRAVVVTRDGDCGMVARSGPGNPVADAAHAAENIAHACRAAVAASPHNPQLVVATVAGILSRDFDELPRALLHHSLPTPLVLASDLLGAYFSGTTAPDGAVMVVGTGAVAATVADGRLAEVRDGLGWLLGDDGSGFWMGHQVARAVAADLDGRGPATSLTARLMPRLEDIPLRRGIRPAALASLLTWSQNRKPQELAELALLAAEEASTDPVAQLICSSAASHVLATLSALPGSQAGPVVLGGGVLTPSTPVGLAVSAALGDRARRVSDGVAGAAMLGIRELGGHADDASLARVVASLAR